MSNNALSSEALSNHALSNDALPDVVPREVIIATVDDLPSSLPLSVAMTDLDGFGLFNDAEGRDAGDVLLASFHDALHANLPPEAVVERIGGDEWAIAFPGLSLENTLVLMGEVRAHVEQRELGAEEFPVTLSVGIASRPPHGTLGDELVRAADEALSRTKREGGNRVGIYVEAKMVMKSNYYSRATLDRLAALSRATNRTEASLLREAADKLLAEHAKEI